MAYNEELAHRMRKILNAEGVEYIDKKMFGGLCFMVMDKMCCGIVKDELMVRVVADKYATMLEDPHCREMDFTGKALKGFLYVDADGLKKDSDLKKWMQLGLEYVASLKS
ncbi:MAG: TfoX/Sxy family protein [Chitinophagales bacterium]